MILERLRKLSDSLRSLRRDQSHLRASVLTVTGLSFALWTTWYLLHPNDHPSGDLSQGVYTDHFSHMNAARLFPRVALQIWQRPTRDLVVPLTPEETSQLPPDLRPFAGPGSGVFRVPGWPWASRSSQVGRSILDFIRLETWCLWHRLRLPTTLVL